MPNNRSHKEFILSPILGILKEAKTACAGIGNNIETQSLSEYVLQTTFLRMTGASEQKLKCICWEMATYNYDYRYEFLRKNYGECSRYKDKNSIYNDIKNEIKRIDNTFITSLLFEDIDITNDINSVLSEKISNAIEREEKKQIHQLTEDNKKTIDNNIRNKGLKVEEKEKLMKKGLSKRIHDQIVTSLNSSPLYFWKQRDYGFFELHWEKILNPNYVTDNLFDSELQRYYDVIVYNHRNRCAHNLKSYQYNLPTLQTLLAEDYDFENYFFRFAILILLDEIFMRLFKKYLISIDNII